MCTACQQPVSSLACKQLSCCRQPSEVALSCGSCECLDEHPCALGRPRVALPRTAAVPAEQCTACCVCVRHGKCCMSSCVDTCAALSPLSLRHFCIASLNHVCKPANPANPAIALLQTSGVALFSCSADMHADSVLLEQLSVLAVVAGHEIGLARRRLERTTIQGRDGVG